MSWLTKLMPARIRTQGGGKRGVPEGLWEKCDSCGTALYGPELEKNLRVCPKCNHHLAIEARERLASFLDDDSGEEIGADLGPVDALHFKDQKKYADRIKASQKSDRRTRRAGFGAGQAARPGHLRVRLRVPLHGRVDGLGRWRAFHAGRRAGAGHCAARWSAFPPPAAHACRKACSR